MSAARSRKARIWIIVVALVLPALALLLLPAMHFSAMFDVAVTWRVRESSPEDHTVFFQGKTFTIPAGRSITRVHDLPGGGRGGFPSTRGWGWGSSLAREGIVVDGRTLPLSQVHTSHERGTLAIFGLSRRRAMQAEISLAAADEGSREAPGARLIQ
ncbi:MAG: hypothetical protein HN904_18735 [Victivallales bacterium]|nr:hypothetical protein [Victivallales bacterium]